MAELTATSRVKRFGDWLTDPDVSPKDQFPAVAGIAILGAAVVVVWSFAMAAWPWFVVAQVCWIVPLIVWAWRGTRRAWKAAMSDRAGRTAPPQASRDGGSDA